jgi:cytidine deaminase
MDPTRAIDAARTASTRAYAPYSNLRVGAAVLARDDTVHGGCNVENASYGLSMCAERNAVAAMVAADGEKYREVLLVAVVSPDAAPCFPCGACRQVLHEFGCEEVITLGPSGGHLRYPLDTLLPHAFGPEVL